MEKKLYTVVYVDKRYEDFNSYATVYAYNEEEAKKIMRKDPLCRAVLWAEEITRR